MRRSNERMPEGVTEALGNRIEELKRESREPQFSAYLEQTARQFSARKQAIELLRDDLERNYKIYLQRMSQDAPAAVLVPEARREWTSVNTIRPQHKENMEYKVGTGVFGVIGFLFIMAAAMMFGMTYIKGSRGFMLTAGIVFVANIIIIFLPFQRGRYISNLVQLAGNVIITWVLTLITVAEGIPGQLILIYIISMIIIAETIFIKQEKDAVNITLFSVCLSALGVLYLMMCTQAGEGTLWIFALLATVCLCFFLFNHEHQTRWIQYWFMCAMTILYTFIGFQGDAFYPVPFMAGVLIVFASSKLLSRVRLLYISEIVITAVTAFCGLYYYGGRHGIWFVAAFLFSALAIHRAKWFYELTITCMCLLFFLNHPFLVEFTEGIAHYEIVLAGSACVLLVSMLCYNLIKPLKVEGIQVYNYICLSLMLLLYLGAFMCGNYVVYGILTVVGILTILVVLREPFGIRTKWNLLFLGIFLVYMVFVFRIQVPLQASVCLIVISVLSIIIGFAARRKESRIFGLALTVFVCLKVVAYDFIGLPERQRMLLFLVVGVFALAIALLYILLEKRLSDRLLPAAGKGE